MLKYLKPAIPLLLVLTLVVILTSLLDIQYFFYMRDLIDQTVLGNLSGFWSLARLMAIILIALFTTRAFSNFLRSFFLKSTAIRVKGRFMKRIYEKNVNEFQKENNAKYISALTNDYEKIETNFFDPIIELIFSSVSLITGIYLFSIVDATILLVAFGLMIVNVVVSFFSSKPVNKHNKERSNMFDGYTSYIKEILGAFHIIKNNNLEDKVKEDYKNKSTQVQHKGYIIDRIQSFIFAIQNMNFSITFIGLFAYTTYLAIDGVITFGAVLMLVNASERLIWPIAMLSESLPKLFGVKSISKKMEETLQNKVQILESKDFDGFTNEIKLEHLNFGYDEFPILENVSVTFKKGGKYLIVGPSGGGKSTVLRLLRKYVSPDKGSVLIDGVNLNDIKKEQYFKHLANIEQQVFLFEDSVRNNLTLYKDYQDDEIEKALQKAGLVDFIQGLEHGLDTIIYDNGRNISGGERSRLAIARGLLNEAQIILCDEAFASLDYEKAKSIEDSILNLQNVTVINVSHVIIKEHKERYDGIFVVKNKQIIETT